MTSEKFDVNFISFISKKKIFDPKKDIKDFLKKKKNFFSNNDLYY